MKYLALLFIIPVSFFQSSCSNSKKNSQTGQATDSIPACMRREIIGFGKATNAPIAIDEYEYKGKKVYLFTADCCDQFNTLYDENCKALCSPSGGLEGSGDHQCPDFSKEAKLVKNIWSKPDK